jgi:hypothetical protein
MIPKIDKTVHTHGPHTLVDRHLDATLRAHSENTPHNESDLRAVSEAELVPQRNDHSLDGDVIRALDYQKGEGGESMTGERYEWDGQSLYEKACDPHGFNRQ